MREVSESYHMTDINTNPQLVNYGAQPQYGSNPGIVPINSDVKEKLQNKAKQSPVARVLRDAKENDGIMGFLYTLGVFGIANHFNNLLTRTAQDGTSLFGKIVNAIDNNPLAQKADDFMSGVDKNGIRPVLNTISTPFKPIINHFKENWGVVNPKFEGAIVFSRDKIGQMTDSLYDAAFNKIDSKAKDAYGLVKRLSLQEKVAGQVDELINKGDFDGLRKLLNGKKVKVGLWGRITSIFGKGAKETSVSKAIDTLSQGDGKKFCQLISWKKDKNLPWQEAYRKLKSVMGNMDEFKVIDDQLKAASGLVDDTAKVMPGKTMFSRGLRKLYANVNDYFNFHFLKNGGIPGFMMTIGAAIAIGNTIQKTIKADKEDKLSTFMEGISGEVVPFVLMDRTVNFVYGMLGGIQKAGAKTKNIFWKAAAAPIRKVGDFLTTGLGKNTRWFAPKGLFGGLMRFALIMTASGIVSDYFMKASYKIFGKPKKTIEEEKKAKAEEEARKAQEQAKDNPQVAQPEPSQSTANQDGAPPPMVQSYIEKFRNNENTPIPGQSINNTPAPASLLTPGQSNFYTEPEPISGTNPATIVKLNTVMAKIDKKAAQYGI